MSGGRSLALALLTLLLLTLLPGLAAAAPRSIALADYKAMLRQGIAHLERADQLHRSGKAAEGAEAVRAAMPLLSGTWRVESPHGASEADLSPLAQAVQRATTSLEQALPVALDLAREHLAAAQALEWTGRVQVPGARETLDEALKQTAARSFIERVQDWIRERLAVRVETPDIQISRNAYYAGGVIALLALGYLGFQLYRTLSGHGTPGESALKTGGGGRPDRPPTPSELRAHARELSDRGDHLAAIRIAHLALLQHYDQVKLIRYVPAQTNREHEWQLRRRHPHLARTLRSLNELVDDRLYSGHGATAEDFLKVDGLVEQLWREGDAVSRSAEATSGA